MKKIITAFGILLILSYFAYAQATGGAEVDKIRTGTLASISAGNDTAQGGNVTLMNLSTTQSTVRWQGYYGNISGSLSLGIGTDIFYNFNAGLVSSVFATQNSSFDFESISPAERADIDAVWNYGSGPDQASDIFTGTTSILGISAQSCELEPIGSGFNSTIVNNGANTTKTSFAFGVNVKNPAVPCFDGSSCEYELIVPADGVETYYFFMTI